MKFHTTLFQQGNNTGIEVPPDVLEALGAGKKPAVNVTLNGSYGYRSSVASMGGKYLIPFSSDHRKKSGIAGGDEIDVDLEVDTAPREVVVPDDFQAALDAEPEARKFWDTLSFSNRLRHVLSVEGAKSADTRQRRIAKSVSTLREGQV